MSAPIDAEFVEHTALAVRDDAHAAPVGLWRTDDPVEVITKATRVADALKAVIVAKKLVTNIQGKEFPQIEAWLTLAAMMNLNSVIEWSRPVDGGWEARCIVKNGNDVVIASAEAQCTRDERMWKSRDDYALRSMAQTRATSKALSSKLRFIMVLAGYVGTPAEEMPPEGDAKPAKAAANPRTAAPARDPNLIGDTQKMDLWRLLKTHGMEAPDKRNAFASRTIGRVITDLSALTTAEAETCIERLENIAPEPVAAREPREEPSTPPTTATSGEPLDLKSPLGRAMFAALGDHKIKSDDDRHIYASTILGRTITSYKQMTAADASAIIDALNAEKGTTA